MGASIVRLVDEWQPDLCNHKWERWWAWRPVRDVYGNWHWRVPLFRLVGSTYVDHDDWTWYYYMTEDDLLLFLLRWS